ncbi:hypothetical protein Clacol_007335 [Clathrus columnatus]|uniref:RING-type domain-containing protein n=1 Tax=Clathrus columnatus TaxID=1419009 RepID=A0AAV5AJN7_9AGAM|nr:hypothetical protein Clacol_007335 [Clathrus columnatus]
MSDSSDDCIDSSTDEQRKRKREEFEFEMKNDGDSDLVNGENSQSIDEEFASASIHCRNRIQGRFTAVWAQINDVSVIPCLHSFDKECLVSWWAEHSTCPTCKSRSTSAKLAFQLKSIITRLNKRRKNEVILPVIHSNDEIFPARLSGHRNGNEDEDLSNVLNDDDDDDVDTNEASQLLWPCFTCSPGNPTGYVCPNPILPPNIAEIQAVGLDPATTVAPERHQRKLALTDPSAIGRCGNYVPNAIPNQIRCGCLNIYLGSNCDGIFCSNVDPDGCPGDAELPFMSPHTFSNHFPFGIKNNIEEVARYQDYVQGRPLTAGNILSALFDVKQEQTREDLNDAEANRLWGQGTWYCSICVTNVLSTTLFDWWKKERKNSLDRGDKF